MHRRDVVVLGSTGSIGTQALDVVRRNPDRFRVVGVTAGGSRPELFAAQVAGLRAAYPRLWSGVGADASVEAAGLRCDVVLNAIDGAAGLRPTLAALEATLTGPAPPVVTALGRTQEELLGRATAIAAALPDSAVAEAGTSTAAVGGGGAPEVPLPSAAVRLPASFAAPLRAGDPAVVGYVEHDRLVLDLIAVEPRDDELLLACVRRVVDACT